MKHFLESLRMSTLTHMEVGQLMRRHLSDLSTIDPTLVTNAPFKKYVQEVTDQTSLFEKALALVRKNEETEKIKQADERRDRSISAFGICINLFALSDDPAEVEASRSLSILFGSYKNLAKLNYEAQTLGMDKLVSECGSTAYNDKINLLQMGRYVARMADTNSAFKNLFSGRMVSTAMTESYDMKTIRADLQDKYADFAEYVVSMAKSTENALFPIALNLLNTARKYYADQVAMHSPKKEAKEKPKE
jgi:hypothetical protein